MNNTVWRRLLLAGACCLACGATAQAQSNEPDARPSHRLLEGGIGDLNGAEDLLARRLGHTHDLEGLQDLIKQGLEDPSVFQKLKDQFKDLKREDVENLQKTLKDNPELLDDPKLHDLLKTVQKFKQGGEIGDLPKETQEDIVKFAKDFFDKQKSSGAVGRPTTGGTPDAGHPTDPPPSDSPKPPGLPPSPDAPPNGLSHEMIQGVAGWLKDIDRSPEGEALRTAAFRELAKMDAKSNSGAASGLADVLKNFLSSEDAAWLANNLKLPSAPNLGGWSPPTPPALGAGPSVGASSDGALDGVVWVVVLALLGAAGWMIFTTVRRRAASARADAWTAGPWPVSPSQVSTRHDLIRAFEHLAYLLLGPGARSLNHLDAAARIGAKRQGRERAASRLARLYEQARYAPPDDPLPADELAAARGDLAALAGAAA